MQRIPLTPLGKVQLEEELDELKHHKRPAVIKDIEEARQHGDLKENAEYHAAKEQQSFIEGRIQEIQGTLSVAQVIDITSIPANDRVIFGSTITVHNLSEDKQHEYQIVGEDEADIKQGKLSINSPIARQLITKSTGDLVTIEIPAGKVQYEILDVKYI
jgi:transcription elongation factor GreA